MIEKEEVIKPLKSIITELTYAEKPNIRFFYFENSVKENG